MNILTQIFGPPSKLLPGVYRIINRRTGTFYIGATTQPMVVRWDRHRYLLRANRHHNRWLQNDWQVYGESVFRFTVAEVVTDVDLVFVRELDWQRRHYSAERCYNPDPNVPWADTWAERAAGHRVELLSIYIPLRAKGTTRDQAKALFREQGISMDNNVWAEAGKIIAGQRS